MKKRSLLFASLLLLVVLYYPVKLVAGPYYEGKRITIIVGFGPGGGNDRMARLFAKHLPKHIPGKPTIIVDNMAGASSMIASNHIFNVAKPNGLTIGAVNKALPMAQLLKIEGLNFDLTKFSWIGSTAIETTVLTIRTDLPYKTFNDLLKTESPIKVGGTGPMELSSVFVVLLRDFVGLKVKEVTYPSGTVAMLAVERKEVDARGGSYSSLKPFIERGLVRPIIRGQASEPEIENLPMDQDFAQDKKAKTLMAMLSAPDYIGRPFVAPPGTPADIMKVLRDAFSKAAEDPELLEDAKKNMLTVKYVPAEECSKVISYVLNQPQDIIREFSKYIKF